MAEKFFRRVAFERLDRLVFGEAEGVVSLRQPAAAVVGALPELAVVVTEEKRLILLRLMPEIAWRRIASTAFRATVRAAFWLPAKTAWGTYSKRPGATVDCPIFSGVGDMSREIPDVRDDRIVKKWQK